MRSWLLLFTCNLMWALQFTCIKLVEDQVGPLFTVWGPMTLAMLMIFPLIRLESEYFPGTQGKRGSDILVFFLLALLGVFPGQVFITWGTRMSLASNAALLTLALPIFTAVLAYIFLRERMTGVRWISFAVAIIGVLMCSGLDLRGLNLGAQFFFGNLLILSGTLGSAFYNSYGKKMLERYSPMEMLFFTYVAMFFIMTPLVLVQEASIFGQMAQFTPKTWIGLALLAFFHNYLAMVLFLKALKQIDAMQAALSNYLIAFFGLPVAAIWLKEKLNPLAIAGGLLILCSTLLITVWENRKSANPSPDALDPLSSTTPVD